MRTPVGVVEAADGSLYITNYGGGVTRVNPQGKNSEFSSDFGRPGVGIVITENNQILAADNGEGKVRLIRADGATEVLVEGIGGCVALLLHQGVLYVSSWDQGAVYTYNIDRKL